MTMASRLPHNYHISGALQASNLPWSVLIPPQIFCFISTCCELPVSPYIFMVLVYLLLTYFSLNGKLYEGLDPGSCSLLNTQQAISKCLLSVWRSLNNGNFSEKGPLQVGEPPRAFRQHRQLWLFFFTDSFCHRILGLHLLNDSRNKWKSSCLSKLYDSQYYRFKQVI